MSPNEPLPTNPPTPISKKPKSLQASSSLPHYDILSDAFVNLDMMEADHKHKVEKAAGRSGNNKNESILEKNLRVSSTSPVHLALQDASRALDDFETMDPVGKALKGGLPKDLSDTKLNAKEIQQLQRKLVSIICTLRGFLR